MISNGQILSVRMAASCLHTLLRREPVRSLNQHALIITFITLIPLIKNYFTEAELTIDEEATLSGGKREKSCGDSVGKVYDNVKNIAVFYGKWVGGMAAGKSWDRDAYDAGTEAGIQGMNDDV